MSQQQQRDPEPIAEAVNGYQQLRPRQVSPTEYRVLSWRNNSLTAHEVDIEALSCSCEDEAYNRQGNEICDHLAVALDQAPKRMDHGEWAVHDLVKLVDRVQALSQEIRDIRDMEGAVRDANAQAAADSPDEAESQGFDGDPVEYFESLLRDAGLDPDDFEVFLHDQYNSLQVSQEGYLDDDEFQTWVDFKDDLDMGYDGDSDRNYLSEEEYNEVFS